jgi:hypothetical protein
MSLSRLGFFVLSGAGAMSAAVATAGAEVPAAPSAAPRKNPEHALATSEYDRAAMLAFLDQPVAHKQVYQTERLDISGNLAAVYVKMQRSMNSFDFSLDSGKLVTLAVLMGNSVALSVDDAMWAKYEIGKVFRFRDGYGNTIGANVFDKARSTLSTAGGCDNPKSVYQDYTGEAIRKRGGGMFVCFNALSGFANTLSDSAGVDGPAILADLRKHMIPGYLLVPSGTSTMQLAQDHGWKPYAM